MSAWTKLSFPTLAVKAQTATEDLMDIPNRIGDMVQSTLSVWGLEQEEIMVPTLRATA